MKDELKPWRFALVAVGIAFSVGPLAAQNVEEFSITGEAAAWNPICQGAGAPAPANAPEAPSIEPRSEDATTVRAGNPIF